MTRKFAELTGPETLEMLEADSVLVLPIGAIEHHGPHLPLITDALMAESAADALVSRAVEAGIDAWQLPTMSVGKSDEHSWASGTLWLNASTLMETLVDKILALHKQGITFLIIEHNMDLVMRICSPIIVMAQGKVIFKGEARDVQRDPRVLDAYLGDIPA